MSAFNLQIEQILLAKLQQTLKKRQLLLPNQHLLVAVSGGQDSLCLLKLLLSLQTKWGWNLTIAHCDHRWEKDTGIAAHVENIAKMWQVPFYLETAVEVTQSEGAARKWRYQALIKIAQQQKCQSVITAHTKSDRAETLLYNLMRGSGADGLQSLTWNRPLTSEINLVRPLLEITRAETGNFCQQLQLPVWDDAYNQELKYARNRIRLQLLPLIKTYFNPQVEHQFAQTAELIQADVEFLENAADQLRQKAQMVEEENNTSNSSNLISDRLNRRILRQAPLSLQRRAVRQFLQDILPSAPNFEQIEKFTALITAPNRSQTDPFPGGAIAQVAGDWIILRSPNM